MSVARAFDWASSGLTDAGNMRDVNEDACVELPDRGIWAVADGMGGHAAGDVASRMIVDALSKVAAHELPSALLDEVEDRLSEVNAELFRIASGAARPMTIGSTVAVLLAFGRWAICLWAGDSRAYRYREGGLEQITRDHSQVEELIEQGEILRHGSEHHPLAHVITRAVGGCSDLDLDIELVELADEDRFLLCTDGLYKDLEEDEIAAILPQGDCTQASHALVAAALEREASDNITVVVVDFHAIDS